jgi:hypothetical protein
MHQILVEESDYKRKAALFIIFGINEYQQGLRICYLVIS